LEIENLKSSMISTMASVQIKVHNIAGQKEKDRVADPAYSTLKYRESGYCRFIDFNLGIFASSQELQDFAANQFAELAEVCDRIAWDERARIVVLGFGGDLKEPDRKQASPVEPVSLLKQPVIAAIGGDAVGVGLELALACDIRIANENARFGLPQVREGQIPSNGGTQRLPRLIGQAKATEMILTGGLIDAVEAQRMGLIHRIVSSDALMTAATDLAKEMSEKSPLSLSYAKEALYSAGDLTLDQGLNKELDLYLLLFSTSDRREGLTAFTEKRNPQFEGI
jgi:enoyl-CoA hydratase/carnithine racemase